MDVMAQGPGSLSVHRTGVKLVAPLSCSSRELVQHVNQTVDGNMSTT